MQRLAVIADDLTGAMDTGLQFAKRGLETVVSMTWEHFPDAQVVAIDTDSRDSPASVARQRVLTVARLLGDRALYKKVDSTMRGNVGYELRALCDALQPRGIVVAPAYPAGGRTTLWGHQRVGGKPLELTSFARDPRWPMRESHLPTMLVQQAGQEVGQVGLEPVARGAGALAAALDACSQQLVVVDALEQSHLRVVARALVTLGSSWLPCGSAGLAEEWVEALGLARDAAPGGPRPNADPVLIVSGSRNEATLAQLRRATRDLGLPRVDLDPRRCYDAQGEVRRLAAACNAELDKGHHTIVTASFSPLMPGANALVAQVLSAVAGEVAARRRLGGLFLTGGDIAVATCKALGVEALRIVAEVQPGIPGGQLIGGSYEGMWVVTKAGGFGDERALLDGLAYLRGEPRPLRQ